MKKLILLVTLFMCALGLNAQNYKLDKEKYDYRTWTYEAYDRYNPGVCGVASFFIPGLGQIIAKEVERGSIFLAAAIGSYAIYGIGAVQANNVLNDANYSGTYDGEGVVLMTTGLIGVVVIGIWSTIDAVRVAKVKNLAWRDDTGFGGIRLEPYIAPIESYNSTQVGLRLKWSF